MTRLDKFETDRLIIRPIKSTDSAFVLELYNTSDWINNIGDRGIRSLEQAEKYITEKMLPQFQQMGFGNYVVVKKSNHTIVGSAGIYVREGLEIPDAGYALLPTHYKQGFAFEAMDALIKNYVELFRPSKISEITIESNVPSRNLLEKLKFIFIKNMYLPNDPEELMYFERDFNPPSQL